MNSSDWKFFIQQHPVIGFFSVIFSFCTIVLSVVFLVQSVASTDAAHKSLPASSLLAQVVTSPGSFLNTLQDGLVAKYEFSDLSPGPGGVPDTSNENNHATAFGNPVLADEGVLGSSMSFDGIDDFVLSPAIPNLFSNSWSLSLWVKRPVSGDEYGNQLGSLFGDAVRVFGGNSVSVRFAGGNAISRFLNFFFNFGTGLSLGELDSEWRHIALSYDGASVRGFFDGGFVGAKNIGDLNAGRSILMLGNFFNSRGALFTGILDDVLLYNRPLSDAEVAQVYAEGNAILVKKSLSAIGCYTFFDITQTQSASTLSFALTDIKTISGPYGSWVRTYSPDESDGGYILETRGAQGVVLGRYALPAPEPIIAENFTPTGIEFVDAIFPNPAALEAVVPFDSRMGSLGIVTAHGTFAIPLSKSQAQKCVSTRP